MVSDTASNPEPPALSAARARHTLAGRIAAVTMLSALVAVLVSGILAFGLLHLLAPAQGRAQLRSDATLVAAAADLTARNGSPVRVPASVVANLRAHGITIVVLQPTGELTGPEGRPLTSAALRRGTAGLDTSRPTSAVRSIGGKRTYVETQPLADGGAVILLQRVADARGSENAARMRVGLSLAIGLAAAAIFGVLLARRITRPLRKAAAAAHRLSTGARDVIVTPEGPAEVAEVAEALNRLAAALATSEAREREFLLSISHELRTPLTAIRGYAEALADGVVAPDAVPATGQVVVAEATRLERLVCDLLDLARLRAQDFRIDLQPVDVAELVRQAGVVWADRCAKEGVEFRLDLPDPASDLTAVTDGARLRQILDGLAENALRVTPAGRPIVFAAFSSDGTVAVQVRDGGPGLTDDDCRVAFERSVLYERYRGVRRVGTGVGLALVAGLAQRLGGRAEAGRAPEGGACFTVVLPKNGPGVRWGHQRPLA